MAATPIPDDFAAIAATTANDVLCKRYGVGKSTLSGWRKQTGIRSLVRNDARPSRPMPDGFALVAPTLTIKEMRVRFKVGRPTLDRWIREMGGRTVTHGKYGFGTKPRVSRSNIMVAGPVDRHQRDMSVAARAVDECLRRYGRVFRCDATGAPLPDGFFWNRNGFVLTDDEVISRAERMGWNRDSWRQVAA